MKKFSFRLDFLLRYRRQKEEMAMLELAQKVRLAEQFKNELNRIRLRSDELADDVREKSAAPIPAPVFNLYQSYLDALRQRNLDTEYKLGKAETEVAKKREKLVEASVDRKMIERFEEMERDKHKAEGAREEQNNLDELAAIAVARKVNGY